MKHRDNTGYATAEDNCDRGDTVVVTPMVKATPSTTANCYSYVRNWSAVDECGNIELL